MLRGCRRQLLQAQWFAPSYTGQLRCQPDVMVALRSMPIYEPAATAAVSGASQPQPSPGSQLPAAGIDEVPGVNKTDDKTSVTAAVEPHSSANGIATVVANTKAPAGQPPQQPVWVDLRGLRLLAPPGVPGRALPHSFIAAESAGAEQVLTELLGVRRVSEAEIYWCVPVRCAMLADTSGTAANNCCVSFNS